MNNVPLTSDDIDLVDSKKLPKHIAIIPDGNRRWAEKNKQKRTVGHQKGADNIIETSLAAQKLGIKAITFYLFSTENWNRTKEEIETLMWLLEGYLTRESARMVSLNIRLKTIGDVAYFPDSIQTALKSALSATAHCNGIDLILALNYGSRNEIKRSLVKIIQDIEDKKVAKEEVTESLISSYLDTHEWNDPDLVVRTSGEYRLSNFMLWQLSYSEIYITEKFWPEFGPQDLLEAILSFQKRQRRQGT